ncbi:MAG TPA: circularly permuted type 2 ATP-grasp protein, partial [Polyangiales bacterium]
VLGVPGLVQAARAGNVAVASPLGTGILQTPAILPYLDGLCRVLLGEPLRLPSVRTVWCGETHGVAEAESMFRDAVVKPTFPEGFVQPVFTAQLNDVGRAELLAKVRANPRAYVVQEHVHGSTTPVLSESGLGPRAMLMRSFAVSARDHYVVMPGGLARVAGRTAGTEVSMQLGAGSKDLWVISSEPVSNFSLLPPVNRPVDLSRGGADLPSRAADNLFWLGRYAERAEGVARLARVLSARLSDLVSQSDLDTSSEFVPLLRTLSAQTSLLYTAPIDGAVPKSLKAATQQLVSAVFDEEGAGTMKAVLRYALRAGRFVRDRISSDTWRVLAAIDDELHDVKSELRGDPLVGIQDALNRVVLRLAAFSGLAAESMTRGQAWRFLDMGRRLERAMTLVTLLRGAMSQRCDREGPLLEAVLEIADSGMTYRRRYLATLQPAPVVDLLLTDDTNPRSVIFQLEALNRHIDNLPGPENGLPTAQERIALGLLTDLKLADIEQLCVQDERGGRPRLSALLIDLATRIPALSDSLSDRYLNHATISRHLRQQDVYDLELREGGLTPGDEP